MSQQVFLFETNITKYVLSIPKININAGEFGQLIINDLPEIVGNDTRGFWNQMNQASPFFGAFDLSGYIIKIFTDSVLTYEGSIQEIISDDKTKQATVTLKSNLQLALEKGCVFASAANSTPATVVREICSLYKIDVDLNSFSNSNNLYNLNAVKVSAFFQGETSVLEAIQQVAEIGVARVYNIDQRLYFETYKQKTINPVVAFSDDSTLSSPVNIYSSVKNVNLVKEQITDYSIEWIGGLPGTNPVTRIDGVEGKSINGGADNAVKIMTLQSAVWIGETWYNYLNRPQKELTWSIPANIGKSLTINFPVSVNSKGSSTFICDTKAINKVSRLESVLVAVTR